MRIMSRNFIINIINHITNIYVSKKIRFFFGQLYIFCLNHCTAIANGRITRITEFAMIDHRGVFIILTPTLKLMDY